MDPDNSGSLQSSSGGGNDEYDLRGALNPRPISHANPPPPSWFDPSSLSTTYTHIQTNSPWPGSTSLRSDPYPQPILSASLPPPTPALDFTNPTAERNPKKRSRASRRAPTTILTTNTTNFRAMVQEFTGIPTQPFSNSPFPRTRFDLFSTVSPVVDTAHNRRHFTPKFQSPVAPFLATSSLSFSPLNSNAISTNPNPNLLNFKQPIPQHLPNPLMNTLIQTTPLPIFSKSSVLKPHNPPDYLSEIKIGGLDEFGLSSEINLPNLKPNDLILSQTDRNAENWRNSELKRGEDQAQIMPINGDFNGNYSTPSNFHGGKESENTALPGEGTTESWICSSE